MFHGDHLTVFICFIFANSRWFPEAFPTSRQIPIRPAQAKKRTQPQLLKRGNALSLHVMGRRVHGGVDKSKTIQKSRGCKEYYALRVEPMAGRPPRSVGRRFLPSSPDSATGGIWHPPTIQTTDKFGVTRACCLCPWRGAPPSVGRRIFHRESSSRRILIAESTKDRVLISLVTASPILPIFTSPSSSNL